MKSICILLQSHYDLDLRVRRKAEALVAAGYSVDVLALRNLHSSRTYTLEGVNVRTFPLGKRRGSRLRYAFEYVSFFFWALVRVTVQMRRRRYDAIDVNTLPDFLIFAGVFAKWMGAKLILDMHEITPEFYMSKYGISENRPLVRFLKLLEKMSFDFADHVITINEPIEDLLVRRGLPPAKSTVIMNSTEETRFAEYARPSAAAAVHPRKFVMMYHGTLTRLYGLDIAIEALALAHELIPSAELWIVGSGPEVSSLKQLAQERGLASEVRFIGQVPPSEIPEWLNKCDAGILPIRQDVFLEFATPNKLPEFIVMGKPVIVSRLRTIRHYFTDKAVAYAQPDNPADLAKQMVRVCRDSDLRSSLVARAREEYAPIRWDVMRQRYLRMIEMMIGGPVDRATRSSPTTKTTVYKQKPSMEALSRIGHGE